MNRLVVHGHGQYHHVGYRREQQLLQPEHHFFHGPNCQLQHTPYGSIPGIFLRTRPSDDRYSECMLHGRCARTRETTAPRWGAVGW